VERVRPNGAGVGLGLSAGHTEFADARFVYDEVDGWEQSARYLNPSHSYASMEIDGLVYLAESPMNSLVAYGLVSLVGDYEKYVLERYRERITDPVQVLLETAHRRRLNLRRGYGLGLRATLLRRWVILLERRWLVGEAYQGQRELTEEGIVRTDQRHRLYMPITSFGLGVTF
jgi:hypothetical protein